MKQYLKFMTKEALEKHFCVKHCDMRFDTDKQAFIDESIITGATFPLILEYQYQGNDAAVCGFGDKYVKADIKKLSHQLNMLKNLLSDVNDN